MIPKTMLAALGTALLLAVSAPAWGHGSEVHGPGWGPGMMAPGWGPGPHGPGMGPGMMWEGGPMGPWMHPHGMMGPGWGQGHMGPGWGPGYMGPGHMGPGHMGPGHMGPGHMGPGWGHMGPGYTGPGYMGPGYGATLREDLGADDVRAMLERRLAFYGNPRIKVGEVTERDEDTIVADIVTQDGSLVERFEIDRHRGFWRRAE